MFLYNLNTFTPAGSIRSACFLGIRIVGILKKKRIFAPALGTCHQAEQRPKL